MPAITTFVLLYFIAAWAIIIGFLQIFGAVQMRKEISNEWMLILSGALSVGFGLLMILRPGAGALAATYAIGFYAITFGVLTVLFSLRLRDVARGKFSHA